MTTLADHPAPNPPVTGWHPDPFGEAKERFWDAVWTNRVRNDTSFETETSSTPIDAERRKAVLAAKVASEVARGMRVESQTDFQAILVSGNRPNHILHLLLSIVTLGLWLIVWLIIGAGGGERRKVVSVDEYGRVLEAKA
jgi:hypothetical protein